MAATNGSGCVCSHLYHICAHIIFCVSFSTSRLSCSVPKRKRSHNKPTRGSLERGGGSFFFVSLKLGRTIYRYIQKMDRNADIRRKLVKKDFGDFWSPAGGASLCTILRLRLRRTSFGSSSGRLGPCRTSRWSKSCWYFLQSFCPVFSTNIFATSLINFFTLIHCAGDPGLADEQVQRLRFCHHDQLWGGPCRHSGETLGIFAYKSKFFQCSPFQSLNGYTLGNRVLQVSFKTNNRKVWRGSTSDSREPNAFQDLRSENCYLAIFSFPRKFITRKKWISQDKRKCSWILPFHQICFWSCWC